MVTVAIRLASVRQPLLMTNANFRAGERGTMPDGVTPAPSKAARARPPTRRRKRRPTAPGGAIPRAARDRHALDASRATNVRTSVAVIQLVANGREPTRDELTGEDFSSLACRLYFRQQAPLYLLPDGAPGAGAPGALLRPVYF